MLGRSTMDLVQLLRRYLRVCFGSVAEALHLSQKLVFDRRPNRI